MRTVLGWPLFCEGSVEGENVSLRIAVCFGINSLFLTDVIRDSIEPYIGMGPATLTHDVKDGKV